MAKSRGTASCSPKQHKQVAMAKMPMKAAMKNYSSSDNKKKGK